MEITFQTASDLTIIDTPPHADIMAREAGKAADMILIPCRPRAFDLDAIQTTADLARASGKPSYVIFTAGHTHSPIVYQEAEELINIFSLTVAPVMLPERAAFHHSVGQGKTAQEYERAERPQETLPTFGRGSVNNLTCPQVNTFEVPHEEPFPGT